MGEGGGGRGEKRKEAPVKGSVSGVSLLQLSLFFASISPLFPQKRLILRLLLDYSGETKLRRASCYFS